MLGSFDNLSVTNAGLSLMLKLVVGQHQILCLVKQVLYL